MLEEARRRGFLGSGPLEAHLDHALGFAQAVDVTVAGDRMPERAADLGSGAGLPGLPLALQFDRCCWTLVESSVRRATFLREAVEALALGRRVEVVEDRAEVVGRSPTFRARFDLVVARSFGPPAVVAECAAPLLRPGGRAVISEPPGGVPSRWPVDGLSIFGMNPGPGLAASGSAYQVLVQARACPVRYPRRVGIPAKRPLF